MIPTELFDDILCFSERIVLDSAQLASRQFDNLVQKRFSNKNLRLLNAKLDATADWISLVDPKNNAIAHRLEGMSSLMHGSRLALLDAQHLNMTGEVLEKLAKNKDHMNVIKLIAPTHFATNEVFTCAFSSLFTFESVHFFGNDLKANAHLAKKEFFDLPSIRDSSEISLSSLYRSDFSVPAAAAWLTSNGSGKQKSLSITADSQLYVPFATSLIEALQKNFTTSKKSAPFNLQIRFITDDDKESETKVYSNETTEEELVVSSFIENPEETPMYTQICVQRLRKGATRDTRPATNSSVSVSTLFGTFTSLLVIGIIFFQVICMFKA